MNNQRTWCAILRAAFAESLAATPDKRARESIDRLDEALNQRSQSLAESTQRLAREL
jgi:hypothetical protein